VANEQGSDCVEEPSSGFELASRGNELQGENRAKQWSKVCRLQSRGDRVNTEREKEPRRYVQLTSCPAVIFQERQATYHFADNSPIFALAISLKLNVTSCTVYPIHSMLPQGLAQTRPPSSPSDVIKGRQPELACSMVEIEPAGSRHQCWMQMRVY